MPKLAMLEVPILVTEAAALIPVMEAVRILVTVEVPILEVALILVPAPILEVVLSQVPVLLVHLVPVLQDVLQAVQNTTTNNTNVSAVQDQGFSIGQNAYLIMLIIAAIIVTIAIIVVYFKM